MSVVVKEQGWMIRRRTHKDALVMREWMHSARGRNDMVYFRKSGVLKPLIVSVVQSEKVWVIYGEDDMQHQTVMWDIA